MTVKLPVVNGAEWHGELIRDLPPQCCGLGELEVVRVGPVAAADQARQVLWYKISRLLRSVEDAIITCRRWVNRVYMRHFKSYSEYATSRAL